jgi:hypothetical protein
VTGTWREAWTAALDELEAEVAEVEALLEDEHRFRDAPAHDPWAPPQGLGPLPLDLRPRADAILGRQLAAAHALTVAMAVNRQQASLAARIEDGVQGTPLRPAYVDQAM